MFKLDPLLEQKDAISCTEEKKRERNGESNQHTNKETDRRNSKTNGESNTNQIGTKKLKTHTHKKNKKGKNEEKNQKKKKRIFRDAGVCVQFEFGVGDENTSFH